MSKSEAKIGFVIFGKPEGSYDLQSVENAAHVAGIPERYVHVISPRSAFIRAAKELMSEGRIRSDFRKSIRDDEDAITFAFVLTRKGVTTDSADFSVHALVKFHKKNAWVEILEAPEGVLKEEITQQAQVLYRRCTRKWTCADVNYLVKKFVGQHSKLIGLRAGVSFLPFSAAKVAEALELFYTHLGVSFYSLPVGHSANNVANITKAIVNDMRVTMEKLSSEIEDLRTEGRLTERARKTRLEDLKLALDQYSALARSTQTDLGTLIQDAGDVTRALAFAAHPVDALISLVQGGDMVPEMLCHLHESDPRGNELLELVRKQAADVPLPEIKVEGETESVLPFMA